MSRLLLVLLFCLPYVFPQLLDNVMGLFGHHKETTTRPPEESETTGKSRWRQALSGVSETLGGIYHKFKEEKTDILNELKSGIQSSDWDTKAQMMCSRFPGLCPKGHLPRVNEMEHVLQDVLQDPGKYLPKVPILNIKDPLVGISQELKRIAKSATTELGTIGQFVTGKLASVCKWMNCHIQTPETIQLKSKIMKKLYEFEQKHLGRDNTGSLNLRADRTQQIKQALLEKAGMAKIVTAADNAVFDKDILLTEHQQNFILNELGKGGVGAASAPAKRASIFFPEHPTQLWDLPITYTLDASLEELEMEDIRQALKEIEEKTCLRFVYSSDPKGHHLSYQKFEEATFCGLSYIGRNEPANPIYLSFQCGNTRGTALHETLHALGMVHQHLRPDRDRHIQIDWSNVNPQHYDMFAVVDNKMFTSYGVKYSFDSIMHYNPYTGGVSIAKPTLIPKVDREANLALMGQRDGMSLSDAELLNKMYCYKNCEDVNIFCGAWALQELCGANSWVRTNCPKSCGTCKRA